MQRAKGTYYDRNRDRLLNAAKAKYHESPEAKGVRHEMGRIRRAKTSKMLEMLEILQNNKCAICSVELDSLKKQRRHIDHCHDTHQIRGILCAQCNIGLGWYQRNGKDRLTLWAKMATYLEHPPYLQIQELDKMSETILESEYDL